MSSSRRSVARGRSRERDRVRPQHRLACHAWGRWPEGLRCSSRGRGNRLPRPWRRTRRRRRSGRSCGRRRRRGPSSGTSRRRASLPCVPATWPSPPPPSIRRRRLAFADDLDRRPHVQTAGEQCSLVVHEHAAAVRVDPVPIRVHDVLGGDRGVLLGHSPAAENRVDLGGECLQGDRLPGQPTADGPWSGALEQQRGRSSRARDPHGAQDASAGSEHRSFLSHLARPNEQDRRAVTVMGKKEPPTGLVSQALRRLTAPACTDAASRPRLAPGPFPVTR